MISQYPTITVERYANGVWNDISAYVASPIQLDVGMASDAYDDRLAKVGTFYFQIDNSANTFNYVTDFPKRTKLRIKIDAGGSAIKTFICYVDRVDPPYGLFGEPKIFLGIHATDWFGLAYQHLLRNVIVQSSKRIDQAITTLLADMPIQPTATDFSTGTETFGIVFDAIQMGKTTIYSELQHFVLSELGRIYIKNNDTLRIENFTEQAARNLPTSPSAVAYTAPYGNIGYILTSPTGNGYLLKEDGGRLLISAAEAGSYDGFINTPVGATVVYGGNVLNDVSFVVQPRQVDMDPGSIYQLYTYNLYNENPAIPINNGVTVTLRGKYPEDGAGTGKTADAAMDVVAPTSLGPSLFIFTPSSTGLTFDFVGGADSWKWSITNASGENKSLTYMELVGRPIYRQQPLEYLFEDTDSQSFYGKQSIRIEQAYQQSLSRPMSEADFLMELEKTPRVQLKDVTLKANASAHDMESFIFTDIGDSRLITVGADGYTAFIQGMSATIQQNGLIDYTLRVQNPSYFTRVALRFSGATGSENVVEFPTPDLDNLTSKTIALWVYIRTAVTDASMVNKYDATIGWDFHMINGIDTMQFVQRFSGTTGVWRMPNGCLTSKVGGWHHLAVTYNKSATTNDPILYLDGVAQTVTELFTPTGTATDDTGMLLRLGNTNYSGSVRPSDFSGSIRDVRIYNRIVSGVEIAAIANNIPYTIDDDTLLFNAAYVTSSQYLSNTDAAATPDVLLADVKRRRHGAAYYDTAVTNGELRYTNFAGSLTP